MNNHNQSKKEEAEAEWKDETEEETKGIRKTRILKTGVLGRQKGQNLWNCRENAVWGYLKLCKQKPATTKNQRTKQKQVWVEQPLHQQQLLQQQQQSINNLNQR